MQSIDIIRLSEKQKQQLITLKRKTGIENWNVLCRWALCMSLADPTEPPKENIPSDSNVEMTWKTFSGEYSEIYIAILAQISKRTSYYNTDIGINELLKIHLNRGIAMYLKSLN